MAVSPLAGVRVLEFPQAIAAPAAGRHLAELGADVIRVENPDRLDSIRHFGSGWLPPSVPREVVRDTRPSLSSINAGKRSIGVDLGHPEGRAVALRLVAASDVVLVNLSARTMPALGLDHERLRKARPDLITCSLPAFGNGPGPYRDFKTWGPNLSALAGLDHLTGWPDRPPCGTGGIAYVDFVVGATAAAAVVAAVFERDMTGEGRFIDLSQHEVAAGLLGPALLVEASGGPSPVRAGNRSPSHAPHGIYPAHGDDRWIAIEVATDEQWRQLCGLAAAEPFATDARYAAVAGRLAAVDELDVALGAWTRRHTSAELAYRLQARGVPAAMVQDLADLASDPQLGSRGFHRLEPHARFGRDLVASSPLRVSGSSRARQRAGPCLGEDTDTILEEIAGMAPAERERLARDRVVFRMPAWEPLTRPSARWARHLLRDAGWEEA